MKTLIKPLLIAFFVTLLSFYSSWAASKPIGRPASVAAYKTGIYSNREGKLVVAVNKETSGAVTIQLTNNSGKVLFSQLIGKHQQSARIRLDLSELSDGNYQLNVTNGVETTTHQLTIATSQPLVPNRQIALN
jgi:hypothetical protein